MENESSEQKEGYIRDFISNQLVKAGAEEIEAVQIFSRLLVDDFGYKKTQIQTHPQFRVRKRPSDETAHGGYPVDIAVFKDEKKEDDPTMIVECKQKRRQDGITQLKIYLNLSPGTKIGIWFNGKEHVYLLKHVDKNNNLNYVEIPTIPRLSQRIEDIGRYKRKDLIPAKNLRTIFDEMRNRLAGGVTGITRDESIADQIINILFCKIYDEINTELDKEVTFRVGIGEDKEDVAARIKKLFKEVKDEYNDVFEEADTIKLPSETLVYIIGQLQNFCVTRANRDAIGEAFEVFIGPALRGGEGQFFTPRNVVKMIVDILDPEPNQAVIDPACGSGGFLIVALEHVWKKLEQEGIKRGWDSATLENRKRDAASRYFRGIDKDSFLSKVTKAYMAIVGDGRGGVFCENSLKFPNQWPSKVSERVQLGSFKIVLTNPPFGAKIQVSKKDDVPIDRYELGHKWKFDETSNKWIKTNKEQEHQPPQILFIERCLNLLEDGGKLGIVLPDGILGNISEGYIRQFILDKAKVIGVIDCPIETFQPSTATKTSILILQKKEGEKKEYPIFMAIAKTCGHDRRGKEILKRDGKPDDDFPEISTAFKKFKREENVEF